MGLLGIHASISGGIINAIDEGVALGCKALQIFTANQRQWKVKIISDEEAEKFIKKWKKSPIKKIYSHTSYLINLAGSNKLKLKKSIDAFLEEVKRSSKLNLNGIIFHPGSFTKQKEKKALDRVIRCLNIIISKSKNFKGKFIVELTANAVGKNFEQIKYIIQNIKRKDKIGVCIDTAHIFEAGYDIKNDYNGVFRLFDSVIGLKYLEAFHINDSKTPFLSKTDRHQNIGYGYIGKEFFKKLVNDKRFKNIPMILETPKEGNWDKRNLKLLKRLEK